MLTIFQFDEVAHNWFHTMVELLRVWLIRTWRN
jgi:hypothetical protein